MTPARVEPGPEDARLAQEWIMRGSIRSKSLAALLAQVRAEKQPLADFGRWCLEQMRYPAPGDIDGGEAQDEAQRLELLVG